jgi:hypothetical protein
MILNREAILDANDTKIKLVSVPEWGGELYIRTMTGVERDDFEAEMYTKKGDTLELNRYNLRARLLYRCICDESGATLFTKKDVDALGKKSAKALDRCFAVAQKLNGLTNDDVEELEKN